MKKQDTSYPVKFELSQYYKIKRIIDNSDVFYSSLFDLTNISFSEHVGTAQINFDKIGNSINMEINPHFWNKLKDEEKTFVILHELSHVIYDHGKRIIDLGLGLDFEIANYATDIVINHRLNNNHYIHRDLFDWKQYCWVETIFEKHKDMPNDKNFEYYYQKLLQEKNNKKDSKLLGNHNQPGEEAANKNEKNDESIPKDLLEDILKQNPELIDIFNESPMIQNMPKTEREDLQDKIKKFPRAPKGSGTSDVPEVDFIPDNKPLPTLVQLLNLIKPTKPKKKYKVEETWVGQHRRYASFLQDNPDILLPNFKETVRKPKKDKKEIWIFMDSSGSCHGMFNQFSAIVVALLKNKDISCRAFAFGDNCKEIDPKKLKISYNQGNDGGFDIIEETILACMQKEKCSYPDNVIVLSDGAVSFDCQHKIKKPQSWILLLDDDRNAELTPDGGKFFLLDENFFDIINPKKPKSHY